MAPPGQRPGEARVAGVTVRAAAPRRTNTVGAGGSATSASRTRAEPFLAPAVRRARRPAGRRPRAAPTTPRRPGRASTGSATTPLRRWTISDASASSRLASRPSSRRSEAAPIRRSGAPVARATRAPSSSAAQSWRAAPNGDEHRAVARRPPAVISSATSHGALLEHDAGRALQRRDPGVHQQQLDPSRSASRARSAPGVGDENAACARRCQRAQLVAAGGERGGRCADLARPDDARDDQLERRIRGASGAASASSSSRPSSDDGKTSSERSVAVSRPRSSAVSDRAPGPARRIARSSRWSSSPGSSPSSLRELAPRRPVDLQRLGLARRAVEREHQLAAQPLAQRVLGDQRLQLADQVRVPAGGEVGVDALLERRRAAAPPAARARLARTARRRDRRTAARATARAPRAACEPRRAVPPVAPRDSRSKRARSSSCGSTRRA